MTAPATALPIERCSRNVCLVRPASFGFNAQTAATNVFQSAEGTATAAGLAVAEFDVLVQQLRHANIGVCVVDDSPEPPKPDAVFPNNWVSFHADGTVVLYPMLTVNRRAERRLDLIEQVCAQLGFEIRRHIDLSHFETQGRYLEGTGSLVLDHLQRIAYANRSARTDEGLVRHWCQIMDYEPLVFDAATPDGLPVYHTNVLLWIGERSAGVGLEWIAAHDRDRVLTSLQASGRSVALLPGAALQQFAGNMLELRSHSGGTVLVMSASAAAALPVATLAQLRERSDALCIAAVPTIERIGGGSVRCMLAEVPT